MQENLRLLYVGCTRAKDKLIFAHRVGKYDWLSRVSAVDSLLDSTQGEGEHPTAGVETTLVIRSLNADMVADCQCPPAATERWIVFPDAPVTGPARFRFHQPSSMPPSAKTGAFTIRELTGPAFFPSGAKEEHYGDIENAVHAYFAALPSMRSFDCAQKEAVAERCLSSFSVSGLLAPSAIVSSGDRFCTWVDAEFPGARWFTEVPVTVSRAEGGHWNGAIDLLLELPDGQLVVIDHKSAPIRREHCAATHITELLRNGASLPEARELARHSDIKMTTKYTHIGIHDQARALAGLPAPKPAAPAAIPASGALQNALHFRRL